MDLLYLSHSNAWNDKREMSVCCLSVYLYLPKSANLANNNQWLNFSELDIWNFGLNMAVIADNIPSL